jgi:hypothetical protein
MSALKKIGKIVGGAFFPLALFAVIFSYTMVQLSQPELFSNLVFNTVSQGGGEVFADLPNELRSECAGKDTIVVEEQNISISCSEITGASDEQIYMVVSRVITDALRSQQGDCSFIDCLRASMSGQSGTGLISTLFSSSASEFFQSLMTYSIAAAAALGAIIILSLDGMRSRLSYFGKAFLGSSVPFLAFAFVAPIILGMFVPQQFSSAISSAVEFARSATQTFYIAMFVAGAGLLVASRPFAGQKSKK